MGFGLFKKIKNSIKNGYTDNQVGDFKNSCIANIIQGFVSDSNFVAANDRIDVAIADEPQSGFLQDIKGFIVEQKDGLIAAEQYYQRATELDPKFANAFYDLGRVIYYKADQIIEANPTATNAELAPKLIPLYNQALPLFNKAKELDPNNQAQSHRFVEDIEYKLELLK